MSKVKSENENKHSGMFVANIQKEYSKSMTDVFCGSAHITLDFIFM